MIYKYEECDLFCVPSSYYLVQCISADFAFDLREQAKEQRIKMLAMPKIGAGLDKMPWKVVLSIIIEVFNDEDITILVCDNSHERELREKVRDFAEESAEKTEPCKRSFDR